jgi:hypothetical protein
MLDFKSTALIVFAGLVLSASPALGQEAAETPTPPAADPADVASIDAIMAAVYDAISGPAGPRDWDRFRSLFIPEARLISLGRNQEGQIRKRAMDVEAYISGADRYFSQNGFFERELARRTEQFGSIAHAFSTYESRHNADDAQPFSRGINSFQLMNDGERWWVVTIYWQAESPGLTIPDKYLR